MKFFRSLKSHFFSTAYRAYDTYSSVATLPNDIENSVTFSYNFDRLMKSKAILLPLGLGYIFVALNVI